jgi:hypothetical protein
MTHKNNQKTESLISTALFVSRLMVTTLILNLMRFNFY